MTDDEIEALIRELVDENLDEETGTAVLAWLEIRMAHYQAMVDLGLADKAD
jgi:hypothetical protein